nr:immunoglobulin heavy chain junction region [Macaca mulatta]MOX01170.1 immunoglobulin heavy chain junction region [Macaca mulatta]MOX01968.1 immunoglobulin heavy chain junction region [Macaca mulatta]MOX04258.1 immunoglobulin heavy chain junction region [Macaca mulatta]MOX05271.1 immunoglobulin heavy chain junction region [Macaca mulatta]
CVHIRRSAYDWNDRFDVW